MKMSIYFEIYKIIFNHYSDRIEERALLRLGVLNKILNGESVNSDSSEDAFCVSCVFAPYLDNIDDIHNIWEILNSKDNFIWEVVKKKSRLC